MDILAFLPLAAVVITLAVRFRRLLDPISFRFEYMAKTVCPDKDHKYVFDVCKESDNLYKCYITGAPSYRGRDTSGYMPHYWHDSKTDKRWICWAGKIKYPEQVKTLCRNWADATQTFIDTGNPLPAFKRR